jgi:hypothetical protein
MGEFLTRNSSLQIAFSRDSFAIRQCLLCLAPRERPIFRTPAHVSDPIILFHDKSEWLNLLHGLIWNSRNNSGDATERSLIESNFLDGTEVIAGVSMRTVAEYITHADKCRELANLVTTPTEKRILEEMAQSWEKLAELRKRDRESEREARCGAGELCDAHPH